MRAASGSMPATQWRWKLRQPSASRRMDCSRLWAITGLNTLSWRWPWLAAKPMVASLPSTWQASMDSASHCVGLTLPGMIELPGSLAGSLSSAKPARGPEPSRRRSLASFISATASVFSAPDSATSGSCPASAANLLGALTSGRPVSAASSAAIASAKPGGALRPVPTAVPPWASSHTAGRVARIACAAVFNCATKADSSWPKLIGVASIRCVRPVLSTPAWRSACMARPFDSSVSAGRSASCTARAAAMCIAVGKQSFEL